MKIKIKRFDRTLPLPEYKTLGAAAQDLYCREEIIIKPQQVRYIKLNIATKIPKGYGGLLIARSSTHKMGIMAVNGIGIIDSDYCGNEDEWLFAAFNFTDKEVKIEKGTRVAQMMILKLPKMEFIEVKNMKSPTRGGFGTTGNN